VKALPDLREGPEVIQLLLANLAMVRAVTDIFQVPQNKVCNALPLWAVAEVSKRPLHRMIQWPVPSPSPLRHFEASRPFVLSSSLSVSAIRLVRYRQSLGTARLECSPVILVA